LFIYKKMRTIAKHVITQNMTKLSISMVVVNAL